MEYDLLESLRGQIDRIDEELLILLKRRFQTSKKIAKYKLEHNMPVFDKERENLIFFDRLNKGRNMQLNEEFVREFFDLILDESKKIQEEFIEKKKNKN
jgi:chorismate mutase